MKCVYCGKDRRCDHRDPEADQEPRMGVQPATPVVERKPKAGEPLFELCDLRSMRCRLCQYTISPGPYQVALRVQHGRMHRDRQEAVEARQGLHEGAVRFLVK